MFDKLVYRSIDKNMNMLVPWYLMAAYAYYEQDDPIISDQCYDEISKRLLQHYFFIDHRHIEYITYEMLESGTFLGKYPSIIEGAVESLRKKSP